jgi:hypothetical protein
MARRTSGVALSPAPRSGEDREIEGNDGTLGNEPEDFGGTPEMDEPLARARTFLSGSSPENSERTASTPLLARSVRCRLAFKKAK